MSDTEFQYWLEESVKGLTPKQLRAKFEALGCEFEPPSPKPQETIMKIEKRSDYSRPERWDEMSVEEYINERIDPPDNDYYRESIGQLESVERKIDRVQSFCARLTAKLQEKGILCFGDIYSLVGGDDYSYRFDGNLGKPQTTTNHE